MKNIKTATLEELQDEINSRIQVNNIQQEKKNKLLKKLITKTLRKEYKDIFGYCGDKNYQFFTIDFPNSLYYVKFVYHMDSNDDGHEIFITNEIICLKNKLSKYNEFITNALFNKFNDDSDFVLLNFIEGDNILNKQLEKKTNAIKKIASDFEKKIEKIAETHNIDRNDIWDELFFHNSATKLCL